jgi:predicted DNA-binding transcriptional regulator YafY
LPYSVEIYPYCIKIFKQRWYVIAYNPYKKRILIYALDRIKNISITDNRYRPPADFDGESFFADCFGIVAGDGKVAEEVRIKVYKIQDRYIRALPLHHSQKEIENTSGYTVFSYHIRPTFDFRQELLSHGSDVEVLEPEWFRDEIAKIISEQYTAYRK